MPIMNRENLLVEVLAEKARRSTDALKMFRPLDSMVPEESQVEYFKCNARQKLVTGGNQSGKTTITCVRDAAFLRDMPVTLPDGSTVNVRSPQARNRGVLVWLIGLQLNHIGQTLYPKLFEPGAFKLIRDESGVTRAFDPRREYDRAYKEKAFPAPPLIPPREIKSISWYYKAERQFSTVVLANGSRLCAYASTADVKQGDQVDRIHIDEAIDNPHHYHEWLQRVAPVQGEIEWSTWPTMNPNSALLNLYELCQREAGNPDPIARMFRFSQTANIYLPDDIRAYIQDDQYNQFELKARREGVFVSDNSLVYHEFSLSDHTLRDDYLDVSGKTLQDVSEENPVWATYLKSGSVPEDWTRYLILDPGTTHPAVLMVAVPPPAIAGDGPYLFCYREIYPGRMDAHGIAKLVAQSTAGEPPFEAMVIDYRAGRQTSLGAAKNVAETYADAFASHNVRSRRTGSHFAWASDNVEARIHQVHYYLGRDMLGRTRLTILTNHCPNLIRQMRSYRKHVDRKTFDVSERPVRKQQCDLVVCLEYAASASLRYVRPRVGDATYEEEWAEIFGRRKGYVNCGPGRATGYV